MNFRLEAALASDCYKIALFGLTWRMLSFKSWSVTHCVAFTHKYIMASWNTYHEHVGTISNAIWFHKNSIFQDETVG